MRRLIFTTAADIAIEQTANWLAEQYFPETGEKFVDELEAVLLKLCRLQALSYPLCKNSRLRKRRFSCTVFKRKWVIAFKFTAKTLTIHEFIWGPKLK